MCRDRILAKNFRPLRSLRLETGGKFNLPIFHFWDLAVQRMWWTLKDYGELNIFGVSNNLISINQHLSIIDTFWKIESESGTLFRFNEIDKQGFEFFFRRKKKTENSWFFERKTLLNFVLRPLVNRRAFRTPKGHSCTESLLFQSTSWYDEKDVINFHGTSKC